MIFLKHNTKNRFSYKKNNPDKRNQNTIPKKETENIAPESSRGRVMHRNLNKLPTTKGTRKLPRSPSIHTKRGTNAHQKHHPKKRKTPTPQQPAPTPHKPQRQPSSKTVAEQYPDSTKQNKKQTRKTTQNQKATPKTTQTTDATKKGGEIPDKNGGPGRDRTCDRRHVKAVSYH